MRKEDPSYIKEESFKYTSKGKEKEDVKESSYVLDEEEANFVKKIQVGTNLEVSFLSNFFYYVRIGHYVVKSPYKEKPR